MRMVTNISGWRQMNDLRFKSELADFAIGCKNWQLVMEDKALYVDNFGRGTLVRKDAFDPKNFSDQDIIPIDRAHLLHKVAIKVCKK